MRKPAVAGQFYPNEPFQLSEDIKNYLSSAAIKAPGNIKALIVPHAAYMFSGEVAATAYAQLDKSKIYENVFIMASSHQTSFRGASVYQDGNYLTPLGEVKVNENIVNHLQAHAKLFKFRKEAHKYEHSIEVQLPFLQYIYGDNLKIVPVVLGTSDLKEIKQIASALKPYFLKDNLFIISSDFSHYPSYEDANEVDMELAKIILENNSEKFISLVKHRKNLSVSNLGTRACGWSSILSLLEMTKNEKFIYQHLAYRNSGDSALGDKIKVVGYNAIAVSSEVSSILNLNEDEKSLLLQIARNSIEHYITKGESLEIESISIPKKLFEKAGAFVTLRLHKKLRACIGNFGTDKSLYKMVVDMSIAAATRDSRFDPVHLEELDKIEIEISVISPLRKIDAVDEIEIGRHGIYIKKGLQTGTYLPDVAKDHNFSPEEFVSHCSKYKAGLGKHGWKQAELFIYETLRFEE